MSDEINEHKIDEHKIDEYEMNQPGNSDATLLAFTYARDAAPSDKTLLQEWTAQYPVMADEMIAVDHARLAAGMTLTDELADGPEDLEITAIGASILAARRTARDTRTPLTSLLDEAKTKGFDVSQLAAALRLDRLLLGRLERRALDTATVPLALVRQIGQVLGRSADEVAVFLRGETRLPAQAHFYARRTPSVQSAPAPASSRSPAPPPPGPSFADAVAGSRHLSADDKAHWLAEVAVGVLGD